MTKYTYKQLDHASRVAGGGLNEYHRRCLADYLRSPQAKADIEAGVWDDPLDPIEQARQDAREIAAKDYESGGLHDTARKFREGRYDSGSWFHIAFITLCHERGLEVPE